jgi:predicted unusual protein kinase regulating ubiquinone biosynthesis (AarF/ABC1/UbiB family)
VVWSRRAHDRLAPGQSLDAWLASSPTPEARNRLGEALFRFYVGTLYRHGVFHADPHPGNYGLAGEGRVIVYDFGCVRRFDAATMRAFAALVSAVRDGDRTVMEDALHALGANPRPTMNDSLRKLLRGFFGPLLVPGPRRIRPDEGIEARQAMQTKRAIMHLALPGKLLFLFRLRFGLYAVLSRIEAEADWAGLESRWADDAACVDSPPDGPISWNRRGER